MTNSASKLNELSGQLGFKLKKQHAGNSQAQESEFIDIPDEDISIIDQEEDTQQPNGNPKIRFAVLCTVFLLTLGLGLFIFLWGAGSGQQVAQKPDSLPVDTATTEQSNKENAELKAKLAAAQQQADAEKLSSAQDRANPKPTNLPVNTTTATTAAKPPTVPTKPTTAKAPAIDPQIAAQRDKLAKELAAIEQAKKASTSQLTALNDLKLRSQRQLVAIDRSKDNAQRQLDAIRKLSKQELAALAALRRQKANVQPKTAIVAVKPAAKPAVQPVKLVTVTVRTQPKPIVTEPTISEQEAIALASVGGNSPKGTLRERDGTTQKDGGMALEGASQILQLQPGMSISGKLASPFITLIGNGANAQKSSIAVVIDRDLQLGGYWRLPAGTAIEFDTQVADNGLIQAVSRRVTYQNSEIKIPAGAFTLATGNNQPLIAQTQNANGDKLTGADMRVALYGGIAQAGAALANSGNSSTVSIGAGTTVASVNNGNTNPLAAFAYGAASPLVQTQITRAQALASKIDQQAQVAFLPIGTLVQIHVAQSVSFSLPISRTATEQTADDNNEPTTSITPVNPIATPTVPTAPTPNAVKPANPPAVPIAPTPSTVKPAAPPTVPITPTPSAVTPTIPSSVPTAPTPNLVTPTNVPTTIPNFSTAPIPSAVTPTTIPTIPTVTTPPSAVTPPIVPTTIPIIPTVPSQSAVKTSTAGVPTTPTQSKVKPTPTSAVSTDLTPTVKPSTLAVPTASTSPVAKLTTISTVSTTPEPLVTTTANKPSNVSNVSTPTQIATSTSIQSQQGSIDNSRQSKLDPNITIDDLNTLDSPANNFRIEKVTNSPFDRVPDSNQKDIKPNPNSSTIPLPTLPAKTTTPSTEIVPLPPIQILKSTPTESLNREDDLPGDD